MPMATFPSLWHHFAVIAVSGFSMLLNRKHFQSRFQVPCKAETIIFAPTLL